MNQSHMKALSFIWNIYTAAQYTALSIRQPVKSQCKFIISIKHQNGPPARSLAFSCSSLKRPGNNTTLELFLQVIKIAIPLPLTSLNLNASQRRYSAVFTYYLTLYFFYFSDLLELTAQLFPQDEGSTTYQFTLPFYQSWRQLYHYLWKGFFSAESP